MPLPQPQPGVGKPPAQSRLTPGAYAAIHDDDSVEWSIRVIVLSDLESMDDDSKRKVRFGEIRAGESLQGPRIENAETINAGHMMTLDVFERGLASGWFGGTRLIGNRARDLVKKLRESLDTEDPTSALRELKQALGSGRTSAPLERRTTWYFYDDETNANPAEHVKQDLALRLGLPGAARPTASRDGKEDYFVFIVSGSELDEPRRPRFTDVEDLENLDLWQPGGKTKPLNSCMVGLSEMVAPPVALAEAVSEFHIVECDHVQEKASSV